ncbi:MAG: hypothetical protein WBA93_16285 [Microcoleaceae cyanobacterium]
MSASQPLTGIELIDCAKANAKQGVVVAAKQCGYDEDIQKFQQILQQTCQEKGIDINQISDLITDQQLVKKYGGIEISPDSKSSL